MKKQLFYFWGAILSIALFFTSCNDDEQGGIPVEMFRVHMFVTNNKSEDLVMNSKDYLRTGDYAGMFRFDTWNVYLDNKLVQSDEESFHIRYKSVNLNQAEDVKEKNISLDTKGKMQTFITDYSKKHVAEYKVASATLFNDSTEHVIRMEFNGIKNEFGYTTMAKYSISVDGIKQEVFYPTSWKIDPQSQYSDNLANPYFILNVDDL